MENVEDVYGLAPAQEGMLFKAISAPGSGEYVEQLICTFTGRPDTDRLKSAWQRVFSNCPALRSIFLWEDLDAPLQVVRREVIVPWEECTEAELPSGLDSWLRADRRRGVSLTAAPLSRFQLVHKDNGQSILVWTFHHLLLDGWSAALVFQDFVECYRNPNREDMPQPPFASFLGWLKTQDTSAGEAFWKKELEGLEPLRWCREEPDAAGHSRQQVARLSASEHADLSDWARANRLTLNTIFHAVWALLLHRYMGRRDLVFGTTLAIRPEDLPDADAIRGCCVNTVPCRTTVTSEAKLVNWLQSFQQQLAESREYAWCSPAQIRRTQQFEGTAALFDTLVVFENYPGGFSEAVLDDVVSVEDVDLIEQSHFPLALLGIPADGLEIRLIHNSASIPVEMACGILAEVTQLLRAVSSPEHTDQTLAGWLLRSIKPAVHPVEPLELPHGICDFADWFNQSVSNDPDAIAVVQETSSWSYKTLDEAANRVASNLVRAGVKAGDRVGLCVERSPELIAGILGAFKTGAAYVPVDPSYPEARRSQVLSGSRVSVAISDGSAPVPDPITVVSADPREEAGNDVLRENAADDPPAYVIFTSGSTGTPRGVAITQEQLLHSTAARFEFYVEPVSRFLLVSSASFDSSVAGIFWTLASGGTLVLPRDGEEKDPQRLAELIASHDVTHTLMLPSLYELLLEINDGAMLASLRHVVLAGEECRSEVCRKHFAALPETKLYNEYGPTEGTVWATAEEITADVPRDRSLIGRPIRGMRVEILDEFGIPLPPEVMGEICLSGPTVIAEYFSGGRQESSFVTSPTDGQQFYRTGDLGRRLACGRIEILGRKDRQWKIRGHRLEPGEIEAALESHPSVSRAVVVREQDLIHEDPASLAAALGRLSEKEVQELMQQL